MIVVGLAVGLVVASAVAAGAGAPPPSATMSVTPTTITYGSALTVSGTGCVDPDPPDGPALTVAVYGRNLNVPNPIDPQGELLGTTSVAEDGTWTFTYTVPAEAPDFTFDASFTRSIRADCGILDPPLLSTIFSYDPVEVRFEVPGATTTTSTPASTTTSAVGGGAAAPAAAAAPVTGAPGYTG